MLLLQKERTLDPLCLAEDEKRVKMKKKKKKVLKRMQWPLL